MTMKKKKQDDREVINILVKGLFAKDKDDF